MVDADLPPAVLGSLFGVGLIAGFVDAIAGGGGLLTVPALLATGLPVRRALGANKLQAATGTTLATLHYLRAGLGRGLELGWGVAFTAAGAAAGAAVTSYARDGWLRMAAPFLLLVIAAYTWLKPDLGREVRPARVRSRTFGIVFGLIIGFYDGFFGPGTGSFWTVGAVLLLGLDLLKATAYAKVMNLTSNLVALAVFMATGGVAYKPALIMALAQAIGGQLGARAATRGGFGLIRPLFLGVVVLLAAKLAFENFRGPARPPAVAPRRPDQAGALPVYPSSRRSLINAAICGGTFSSQPGAFA
jgi:uncharacterized protein